MLTAKRTKTAVRVIWSVTIQFFLKQCGNIDVLGIAYLRLLVYSLCLNFKKVIQTQTVVFLCRSDRKYCIYCAAIIAVRDKVVSSYLQ